ncbi:MAG: LCP family protein [Lachnospiraceae bacterium]|jgi:LCP family protein required for cell wall assembly|nr:LCP family protein [Lachnospiraceae bacterium]GFI18992.1 putative cell wall biosynthesis protein LcpB [Lachnospiraceae bacterium]
MTTTSKKPVKKRPVRPEEPVNVKKKKKKKVPASAKKQSKNKRTKILLFILEIFILLIMVVVLYSVLKVEKVGKVTLPEEDIVINPEVKEKVETTTMKGYRNIALFGVDSTTGALTKNTRSDTIMIASINQDTGECKLVSVYRDTYLNLSNDSYNKCNAAYAKGGPMQAINMLNMNLDMNITDFVTVGFAGLSDTIDALGGVMIDVDSAELQHINNYQICMAEDLKRSYTPVTDTGYQLLDGLQATAYCRIRYTAGDDFKRAERQREVLMAVADKAKSASPATLNNVANAIFDKDEIYTSLDLTEILELLGDISKYEIVAQGGFPEESMRATGTIGSKGSCVVPVSLADNVQWLHEFLFADEEYTPSAAVLEYSDKVKADTSAYVK